MPLTTPSLDSAQTSAYPGYEAIDLEVLRSFDDPGESVEDSLMIELIDLYLVETARLMQVIRVGLDVNDLDSVTLNAHSLKGSSSNLGISSMAILSERIEHFHLDGPTRLELLDELEQEFAHVIKILTEERGRRADANTDR